MINRLLDTTYYKFCCLYLTFKCHPKWYPSARLIKKIHVKHDLGTGYMEFNVKIKYNLHYMSIAIHA